MKLVTFAAAIAIMMMSIGAVCAPNANADTKSAPLICPVTGDPIPSVKDAVGHSVYKGKTYYFCCAGCKPLFDANPAKYVKALKKQSK